eukprot:1737581-Prymnesium_polylepis.1
MESPCVLFKSRWWCDDKDAGNRGNTLIEAHQRLGLKLHACSVPELLSAAYRLANLRLPVNTLRHSPFEAARNSPALLFPG